MIDAQQGEGHPLISSAATSAMSLDNLSLVLEGHLLFLCSKVSGRCISEERKRKNTITG